jgi:hypothetical protein
MPTNLSLPPSWRGNVAIVEELVPSDEEDDDDDDDNRRDEHTGKCTTTL